jgi:hypothetical protein
MEKGTREMTTFTTQDRQDAERELVNRTPLTDEQIHDIWKSLWEGGDIGHIAYTYARAIERAHGIGE